MKVKTEDLVSRTERLLEILIELRTRHRFTVGDMATAHGVSRRTMLRDLQALSAIGVPLAARPGPHGGYELMARERLLPLALTVDEAMGMILSYEAFVRYAQSPFSSQSLSAVTKLRNPMPPDVVARLDRLREVVAVVGPNPEYEQVTKKLRLTTGILSDVTTILGFSARTATSWLSAVRFFQALGLRPPPGPFGPTSVICRLINRSIMRLPGCHRRVKRFWGQFWPIPNIRGQVDRTARWQKIMTILQSGLLVHC